MKSKPDQQPEQDEYAVVELEDENGVSEEYLILETIKAAEKEFALLVPLSEVDNLEDMSVGDWERRAMQGNFFVVLRSEPDGYYEPTDDEFQELLTVLGRPDSEDER